MEPKWIAEHQAELDECLEDLYEIEQRVLRVKLLANRAAVEAEKAEEAQE